MELGFAYEQTVQVYFACGKNIRTAKALLMENARSFQEEIRQSREAPALRSSGSLPNLIQPNFLSQSNTQQEKSSLEKDSIRDPPRRQMTNEHSLSQDEHPVRINYPKATTKKEIIPKHEEVKQPKNNGNQCNSYQNKQMPNYSEQIPCEDVDLEEEQRKEELMDYLSPKSNANRTTYDEAKPFSGIPLSTIPSANDDDEETLESIPPPSVTHEVEGGFNKKVSLIPISTQSSNTQSENSTSSSTTDAFFN